MSKDKNTCDKHINDTNEYQKCCNSNIKFNCGTQSAEENHLLKFYEDCDSKDILTSNGRDIMYKVKTGLVYAFWVIVLLTALSMKNTLDNINARMHNPPSVTTK